MLQQSQKLLGLKGSILGCGLEVEDQKDTELEIETSMLLSKAVFFVTGSTLCSKLKNHIKKKKNGK